MSCWESMSCSVRSRRALAASGCAIGSNADGLATMPASSAASQGARTEAQDGRWTDGVLSPQPPALAPLGELWLKPWILPKYTRAADSTP